MAACWRSGAIFGEPSIESVPEAHSKDAGGGVTVGGVGVTEPVGVGAIPTVGVACTGGVALPVGVVLIVPGILVEPFGAAGLVVEVLAGVRCKMPDWTILQMGCLRRS